MNTMKGFEQIAHAILDGATNGYFRLRNGEQVPSEQLTQNKCPILGYDYPYILGANNRTYTPSGQYYYGYTSPFDVVEFVKKVA